MYRNLVFLAVRQASFDEVQHKSVPQKDQKTSNEKRPNLDQNSRFIPFSAATR
jgi:hypothetical protein